MQAFDELVSVIERLRKPGGCSWDREQTHESLKPCLIEECYELIDAINSTDQANLKEELGDVLLQVLMHATIAAERDSFNLTDVIVAVKNKMIERHPHVFNTKTTLTSQDVTHQWESIKASTRTQSDIFESIPSHLPELMKAKKIQKKVAQVGFDWPTIPPVIEKIKEEIDELTAELNQSQPNTHDITGELGDILFSVVNLCRKLNVDPEQALSQTNETFKARWHQLNTIAKNNSITINELSTNELENLWARAKETTNLSKKTS